MKIHTAFLKRPLKFAVNVSLYAVHVGSVLQQYASLQGVGVMLHHVKPSLPVAVLDPSFFFHFACLNPLMVRSRRRISPHH